MLRKDTISELVQNLDLTRHVMLLGWESALEDLNQLAADFEPRELTELGFAILSELGLEEFIGIDFDIMQFLTSLDSFPENESLQSWLKPKLRDILEKQIAKGGPTALLDIDRMSKTNLASLIPRILDLRMKEAQSARIYINDGVADLRDLWTTSYGFAVLRAMGMGLETGSKGARQVEKTMNEAGYPIELRSGSRPMGEMQNLSKGMRDYIHNSLASLVLNGIPFPRDRLYSDDQIWVRAEGNNYRIGLTALLASTIGTIKFIRLRPAGKELRAGRSVGTVESQKYTGPIKTPIGGRIVDVNHLLYNYPSLVNSTPYDAGWIAVLEPDSQPVNLHTSEGFVFEKWVRSEINRCESGSI